MKRNFSMTLIAGAALIAISAPLVLAGPHGGGGDRMLRRADLNGDGAVTTVEAEAVRNVAFLRMDVDGDGVVTRDEMEAQIRARIQRRIERQSAKRFARWDGNGDGRIDRAEFDDSSAAEFARLDADGDGRVALDELGPAMHGGRHHGDGHHGGHGRILGD